MRSAALAAMLSCATALAACVSPRPFRCAASDQCGAPGAGAVCEPTGYCSFPDPACASGRRYGEHAGDAWWGLCVPDAGAPDAAHADAAHADAAPLDGALLDAAGGSPDAALVDAGGADAGAPDAAHVDAAGGDAGAPDASAPDGGVLAQACGGPALFADDFDDGASDPRWDVDEDGGAVVAEVGGRLRVTLPSGGRRRAATRARCAAICARPRCRCRSCRRRPRSRAPRRSSS